MNQGEISGSHGGEYEDSQQRNTIPFKSLTSFVDLDFINGIFLPGFPTNMLPYTLLCLQQFVL
jgi:hypothetical protein